MSDLSPRTLTYFLAVVEEGSFTGAARRLRISQPALSHQIRGLEQALGGPVLERLATGVQPTPAGRALMREAPGALAGLARAARAARAALRGEPLGLEIATFPSLATGTLLAPICLWHDRYPESTLRLTEFRQHIRLQEAVRSGLSDLAFGSLPVTWGGPRELVARDTLVVVLPQRDPLLAYSDAVELIALAERPWVLVDPEYGFSDLVISACDHAGFQPDGMIATSQVEAAARLASTGLGVTLVPSANVPADLRELARPTKPCFASDVWAYARHEWTSQARTFLQIVAEQPAPDIPVDAIAIGPRETRRRRASSLRRG